MGPQRAHSLAKEVRQHIREKESTGGKLCGSGWDAEGIREEER